MSSCSGNSSNNSSNNTNNTVHQHLHSPSKLTEFARNFEDKPDTLFGRVVNKIQNVYNQSYNTVNDISSTQVGKSMFYNDKGASQAETVSQNSSSSSSSLSLTRPQPPNTLQLRTNTDAYSTSSNSNTTTTVEHTDEANERVGQLPSEANQQGRTVSNVLKHISNIVASKNNNVSRVWYWYITILFQHFL